MKRYAFVLAALASLAGAGDAFAQNAGCVTVGLPAPYQRAVSGKVVFVRPLATVLDGAVDDSGANGNNDALAVYCVTKRPTDPRGAVAMCLTGEFCPWR